MRLIESLPRVSVHGVERLDLLRQEGSFVPNNSTAGQHFLMCYGVALDEIILLYLSNTFWELSPGILRTHKMDTSKVMKDSLIPKKACYGCLWVQTFVAVYF